MKHSHADCMGGNSPPANCHPTKKARTTTPSISASQLTGITPRISRRVQACNECRKRKIRCDFENGESTCVRCKEVELNCVVPRSLQTILDDDVKWKHRIEGGIVRLRCAVEEVMANVNIQPLSTSSSVFLEQPRRPIHKHDMAGSQPLFSSLKVLSGLRNTGGRSGVQADFVDKGIISLSQAQEMFETFQERLSYYLYSAALVYDNLDSARASSSLLSSAIFTVTSLHMSQYHQLFPTLYQEFLTLVSNCMFELHHQLDDVRGLCIGAFWLIETSWRLSGHAIRIATEMNIHKSFQKALAGSGEHYERARLWYLLYVCDHHFSNAYGRPPMIRDHELHWKWKLYLQSPLATKADNRVLSQVSLFIVMTRINHFCEDWSGISEDQLSQLAVYNEQLENWRSAWQSILSQNNFASDYYSKGVDLHYHFALFQLKFLALRSAATHNISVHRKDLANMAITSAHTVLSIVLEEPLIRESLVGVPLYINNTMVCVTAGFLLKATMKWKSADFTISSPEAVSLVQRVIRLLGSPQMRESLIIPKIATGLENMLHKCMRSPGPIDNSWLGEPSSVSGIGPHGDVSTGVDSEESVVAPTNAPHTNSNHQETWQTYYHGHDDGQMSGPSGAGVLYPRNTSTLALTTQTGGHGLHH